MLDLYGSTLRSILKEYGFDDVTDDQWRKAYITKINEKRDNLIEKGEKNKDFYFLLKTEVKKENFGRPNKCETNTWEYIREKLAEGKDNFFPVGGFGFEGPNLFPVEHWWVYDKSANKHIEVTPLHPEGEFRCYAGVVNFNINDDIAQSTYFHDVDFLKGGHVYHNYFK